MSVRPRYFVILGAMRTGSNLLEKTLEALGDTACYGEAFNPGFISGPLKKTVLGWDRAARDRDPLGFLRAIIAGTPGKIPGFRLFDGHAPQILRHVLSDPGCARIILRRDPLESFISLQIARATDQWMLRNPRRRARAKVPFVPTDFAAYRDKLGLHYDSVDQSLADSGLDAFRVDYPDLMEPQVMRAIAGHIGSAGNLPDTPPILRQNPESLPEKVTNPDALTPFLNAARPELASIPAPPAGALLLATSAPLALVPLSGPGLDPALLLMQRIDALGYGASPVPPGQIIGTRDPTSLFSSTDDPVPDHHVFTVVCHPMYRLHAQFIEDLFGGGWYHSPVRRHLASAHLGLPSPKLLDDDPSSFPVSMHRAAFDSYLQIVDEAADGKGTFAPHDGWISQTTLIDRVRSQAPVQTVLRLESFSDMAGLFCRQFKTSPVPPGQRARLASFGTRRGHELERIADPDLVARIRAMMPDDFDPLGYDDKVPECSVDLGSSHQSGA